MSRERGRGKLKFDLDLDLDYAVIVLGEASADFAQEREDLCKFVTLRRCSGLSAS